MRACATFSASPVLPARACPGAWRHEGPGPAPDPGVCACLRWLLQVAQALCFLHQHGLVHGGVKAQSVILADSLVDMTTVGGSRSGASGWVPQGGGCSYHRGKCVGTPWGWRFVPQGGKGVYHRGVEVHTAGLWYAPPVHRGVEVRTTGGWSAYHRGVEVCTTGGWRCVPQGGGGAYLRGVEVHTTGGKKGGQVCVYHRGVGQRCLGLVDMAMQPW